MGGDTMALRGAESSGFCGSVGDGFFQEFLNTLPAIATLLDKDGRISAVNQAWLDFAAQNGAQADTWIGRSYRQACMDSQTEMAAQLDQVLSGQRASFSVDYPCHSPDTKRWFRCMVSALHAPDSDDVVGATVLHVDVSTEHLAAEAARAANEAKSRYLAGLAHELRTPLNAIIGFSEIMSGQLLGPLGDSRYVEYSGDILQSGRYLLELINDILDLAKLEAGHQQLDVCTLELGDLLRQCLHMLHERAQRHRLSIAEDGPGAPLWVEADPLMLRQVALNLLSNAIKFTPPGGSIVLCWGIGDSQAPFFAIRDNGIGIAQAELARVMEPFTQATSARAINAQGREKGTGLGLPLSRQLMELHGGSLSLASALNQGTTALALLPASCHRPQHLG